MRKYKHLYFAVAVTAIICTSVTASETDLISRQMINCLASAKSTASKHGCVSIGYTEQDKELNKVYGELLKNLNPSQAQALRNSEARWLSFRNAEFNLINSILASSPEANQIPIRGQLRSDVVKSRTEQLNALIKVISDGNFGQPTASKQTPPVASPLVLLHVEGTKISFSVPVGFLSLKEVSPTMWDSYRLTSIGDVQPINYYIYKEADQINTTEMLTRSPYFTVRYPRTQHSGAVSQRNFDTFRQDLLASSSKLESVTESSAAKKILLQVSQAVGLAVPMTLSKPIFLGVDVNSNDRIFYSQVATVTGNETGQNFSRTMVQTIGAIFVRGKVIYFLFLRDYRGEESAMANRRLAISVANETLRLNQ